VVIFEATVGVGLVKYYSKPTAQRIASQLAVAAKRAPGAGLDLSVLNVADPSNVFRKKEEAPET